MKKQNQTLHKLDKYLAYVLGRRPDEFGLIPDANGYVKIKELLQALKEESDWRHLRLAHLNELMLSSFGTAIEIKDQWIRVRDISQLPVIVPPTHLPKLLYTAIRQRAYPAACAKGLKAPVGQPIILSSQAEMAGRLGRRKDHAPVILTVQAGPCESAGVRFRQFGQILFLCDFIPTGLFSGPALPKGKPHPNREPGPFTDWTNRKDNESGPKMPGSYFPDLTDYGNAKGKGTERRRRREIDWKKERRRARRDKLDRRNH